MAGTSSFSKDKLHFNVNVLRNSEMAGWQYEMKAILVENEMSFENLTMDIA